MVFIATADTMPQAVQQESIVLAATSNSASSYRTMNFGICKLFYATEDDISEEDDSSVNSLHPTSYMNRFLPTEMQDILHSQGSAGMDWDWDWYSDWLDSFKVTIVRDPAHGKFVNLRNDQKLHDLQYLPDRNYFGKDSVDVLVEGKDERGRPIALSIKYFINVLPSKEVYRIANQGTASIVQTYKKLCGVDKGVWDILPSRRTSSVKTK